jgi:sortase A
VQQGLGDPVLNVSIGHDPSTLWPGPNSAALLAAHDVSFFSHLNLLSPGDIITYTVPCATYTFKVEGSQVSSPGASITVPKTGAIVLDTCYPPNALWFTPDRYIVTAIYVSTQPQSASITKSLTATLPTETALSFPTPPGLSTAQLSLSNNTQDMGQLTFSPTTSSTFQQSDAPLQVEGTALEGWFAVIHSLESNLPSSWHAFAPSVSFPTNLSGQNLHSSGPLEITEEVHGSTPVAITLSGSENGQQFTVQEAVTHTVVTVTGFTAS